MASPGFPLRAAADGPRRIGMPRALLHYRYGTLWTTFFEALGCDVVLSDPTDRSTVAHGDALSNDECCLASKIYLGHVASLVDSDACDAVFVPSIANVGRRRGFCTKFQALPDLVANTFADQRIEVLSCLVNEVDEHKSMKDALIELATHPYLAHDAFMGGALTDLLESMNAVVLFADEADRERSLQASFDFSDTLPWIVNREIIGAITQLHHRVDGIVLVSAFPCGPDSMTDDAIVRCIQGKPVLNLTIDAQSGTAGLETRVESFIDILRYQKKGGYVGA